MIPKSFSEKDIRRIYRPDSHALIVFSIRYYPRDLNVPGYGEIGRDDKGIFLKALVNCDIGTFPDAANGVTCSEGDDLPLKS